MKVGDEVKIIDCQRTQDNERLDIMKEFVGIITVIEKQCINNEWVNLKDISGYTWRKKWLRLLTEYEFISKEEMKL